MALCARARVCYTLHVGYRTLNSFQETGHGPDRLPTMQGFFTSGAHIRYGAVWFRMAPLQTVKKPMAS